MMGVRSKMVRLFHTPWFRWSVTLLLCLLFVEVVLRVSHTSDATIERMPSDPHILWLPVEGDPREATFTMDDATGQGGRSMVFVGDSSVYGHGVDPEESFPALVATHSSDRIRSLNLAAPGYSTIQSLKVLEAVLPRERPELVVVASLWSDANFDTFVDEEVLAKMDSASFRFFYETNRFLAHSAIWRWLLRSAGKLTPVVVGWGTRLSPKVSGRRRVEINDYAANLEQMCSLAEANGSEVLFVMLANQEDLLTPGDLAPWHPYRLVMEETAQRLGYPLLRLPDELRSTGQKAAKLFLDEMHPSKVGHQIIAETIIRRLEELGWMDGGTLRQHSVPSARPRYCDPMVARPEHCGQVPEQYSLTGILDMPPHPASQSRQANVTRPRYKLEATTLTTVPVVLDSVALLQTHSASTAFVLTVDPLQPVALRLRKGETRHGATRWGQSILLTGDSFDLTQSVAWAIRVSVAKRRVAGRPALPFGWQQFARSAP
jgi:lysophospholipase L1-like esterase